jgi:hypothetical protein
LKWPPLRYGKRRKRIYTLMLAAAPGSIAVPNIVGMTQPNAVFAITSIGLTVGAQTTAYSATVAVGLVISQSPTAGSPVATGTAVAFVLSLGPAPVPVIVPNVIGSTQSIATTLLTSLGFTVTVSTAVVPGADLGDVTAQSPAAGTPEFLPFAVSITIAVSEVWPVPSTVTNLPCRGAWELPGGTQALWVFGSGCYLMTVATDATAAADATFAIAKIGTLATNAGPVCIRDNGPGGYAVLVDGPYGYLYNVSTQAFNKITDTAFLGADRVAFIDGWWVFNQPGTQVFYTQAVQYGITFNASNFALKDGATDKLITLHENKQELWLIGEKTSEIWYDAGGQYFAFARLVSTMLQVGCAAKHSIARYFANGEGGLVWLGKSERGQNVVVKTEGFAIQTISTPAIAVAIAKYHITADAIGYVYQEDQHEFYVLTFPTADATWVYDFATNLWHERLSYDPYAPAFHRHRSSAFVNFQDQRLVGDYQNGAVYKLSRDVYTDAGWPLVAQRRTRHVWDGDARERVFMATLQIEFAPGVGKQYGLGSEPEAILTISRDGGTTWGSEIKRKMGRVGAYLNRVIWRRLGFARDSVIDVKVIDPVKRDVVGATLKAFGGE